MIIDEIELEVGIDCAKVREPPNLADGGRAIPPAAASAHVALPATLSGTNSSNGGSPKVDGPRTDANLPDAGVAHTSPPSDVCLRSDLKNTRDAQ